MSIGFRLPTKRVCHQCHGRIEDEDYAPTEVVDGYRVPFHDWCRENWLDEQREKQNKLTPADRPA